jgi:hypothetical protein
MKQLNNFEPTIVQSIPGCWIVAVEMCNSDKLIFDPIVAREITPYEVGRRRYFQVRYISEFGLSNENGYVWGLLLPNGVYHTLLLGKTCRTEEEMLLFLNEEIDRLEEAEKLKA